MSKIRITKEFTFEMAHALYGHDGPCKNIHGHSYQLSVTLIGKPIKKTKSPKLGMVLDFSDLKKIIAKHILLVFDHALVLNKNSSHKKLGDKNSTFEKIILVDYQPTCENLLIDFTDKIISDLPSDVSLHHLKLRETATSYAEWFAEDNNL